MDINEYIQSGIVESYVLGLATGAERLAFEALSLQFPEIIKAREAFEIALEARLMEEVVAPRARVKNNTLQSLGIREINGINNDKESKTS